MKKIPLTQGKFALVDDKDFEWLKQFKWHCGERGRYAVTKRNGTSVRMHRMINKTPQGFETDHINRNTFDNQRKNLRTVTHAQNMFNLGTPKNNTSGYKGVSWHKPRKKWQANFSVNNKTVYIGLYSSIKEAILARKKVEQKYYAI